ncbi:MAG: hypothetical protein WC601_03105 [Desulfotomaculaceae bacterium]
MPNSELKDMLRAVIQEELNPVRQELQELRQGQEKLGNKADKLEIRMENEVIDKIRVLFDADKVREEKLNQVVEKLDSIEIDTGYLVSRVSRLEKMAK